MPSEAGHPLAGYLHQLTSAARFEKLSDRVLIECFAAGREEDAFAALVRRHGPMVLRVCRNILHDVHAAEDAFQATFLVLSRKAASQCWSESVGCWLHAVAFRLAQNARKQRARRLKHEAQSAIEKHADDPLAELSVREAQAILDEELARLPEKYRAPLVLCCLEGKSREEAARQLGWSAKLVKSRLEQGREKLRSRLIRRGLTLPAALMAALLAEEAAPAAVPALLIRTVVQATRSSDGVSASVARLAESALGSTAIGKAKAAVAGMLLLTGVLAAGVGALAPMQPAEKQSDPPAAAKAPEWPNSEKQGTPHTDCYGDPLPSGALARLGTVRFRPGEAIAHIVFSPDGKLLAVATQNMEGNANLASLSLWDRATGKRLRQFGVSERPPSALAFAPDGKTLATWHQRDEIQLWDVKTGKVYRHFKRNSRFSGSPKGGDLVGAGFAFSPDGRTLAARGADRAIHLRATATGEDLRKLEAKSIDSSPLTFSRDGKMLAASAENAILLLDVESGKEKARLRGHSGFAGTARFSPDGKTLTAAATTPGQAWQVTAYVWDIAAAKLLHKWDLPVNPVFCCGISPDGKTVVPGGEASRLRSFDAFSGKELCRLNASFRGAIFSIGFSPDGKAIAAGGENRVLQLWDAESGKPYAPFVGHQGTIKSLSLSANGEYLASLASDQRIVLWDTATAKPLDTFLSPKGYFYSGVFSPDGRSLAVAGDDPFVRLLEIPSGKDVQRFGCGGDRQNIVAFSPDGRLLAAGSGYIEDRRRGKSIRLWETATGELLHQFKPPHAPELDGGILSLAFSPDGRLLASGGYGEAAHIWDVATGKMFCPLPGHPYWVPSVRFSPDGQTLAATHWDRTKKTIRLWEVRSGKERGQLAGHTDRVSSLAFAPDGRLASASDDKTIRVWDLDNANEMECFRGHESVVGPLVFSSDGRRLISGSFDTTILVWDMKSRAQLRPPKSAELSAKEFDARWADLADADASKAFRAIRTLIRARQQSVSFFKARLRPTAPANTEKLAAWIAELDNEQFEARSEAEAELKRLEELAEPVLRRTLQKKGISLEQRRRIEGLLQRLEGPITSLEALRRLRALELLEHIGSPEARQLLRTLAEGAPEARLTRQAKAALERIAHRSIPLPHDIAPREGESRKHPTP